MQLIEPQEINDDFKRRVDQDTQIQEDESTFEACARNPAIFMREMIGVTPYYWQARILTDIGKAIRGESDQKKFVILTSRQIGKSSSLAVLAVWSCVFNHANHGIHNTTKVGSFSMSETQSKKLMNEIKLMMKSGDVTIERQKGRKDFFTGLLDSDRANNKSTVSFEGEEDYHPDLMLEGADVGPSIHTYAPTDSVLGETFSLGFIDEAGKVDDYFYDDVFRQTMNASDGVKVFTSTPWQASGFFYEMIKNRDSLDAAVYAFSVEALKSEDKESAKKQMKSVRNDIENMRSRGKTAQIKRQYYCEFVQGNQQFFDPDVVDDMFARSMERSIHFDGPVDVGIDFGGKRSSHTVITASHYDEDADSIKRVWHKRYPIDEDRELMRDMRHVVDKFDVQRIIPDDCPQGDRLIKQMKHDEGWNVKPMNFTRDKVRKYSAFDDLLSMGRVYSYDDADLREEMKALEKEETRTRTKISAPRNYTDDLIDSFVMSCYFFLEQEDNAAEVLYYEPE